MAERLAADPAGIARAAALLRDGEVLAFPTDTVYGIGCRGGDAEGLRRIFAAKRRPLERAIPMLVASLTDAEGIGFRVDGRTTAVADRFWPGPLTLVLPSASGDETQAFRVPDHPVTLALVAAVGPLSATSANRSGEPETLDADDVAIAFADGDDPVAVVDGGRVPGGVASTVLDLAGEPPRLLREGPVSRAELESTIGPID